jgi:hypothetical protein
VIGDEELRLVEALQSKKAYVRGRLDHTDNSLGELRYEVSSIIELESPTPVETLVNSINAMELAVNEGEAIKAAVELRVRKTRLFDEGPQGHEMVFRIDDKRIIETYCKNCEYVTVASTDGRYAIKKHVGLPMVCKGKPEPKISPKCAMRFKRRKSIHGAYIYACVDCGRTTEFLTHIGEVCYLDDVCPGKPV